MADRAFKAVVAGVIAFGIAAIAWAEYAEAQAPDQCRPASQFIADLKREYNEVKVGGGQVGDLAIVGIFSSPNGDTWTILRFMPDGSACGLAAGKNLVLRPILEGEPA